MLGVQENHLVCDGLATAVVYKDVVGIRVKMDSMRCGSSGMHAELSHTVLFIGEASNSRHACLLSLFVAIRFPCKLL
jgi:hypothetical protein